MANTNKPTKSGGGEEVKKARKGGAPDAKRAEATERAAQMYLASRRAGNDDVGLPQCCDAAAAETGYPRPAESSVRRTINRLMTDDEREAKRQEDARADRRAEATRRAAEIYREANGNHVTGDGIEAVLSVTKCCEMVTAEYGVRPAESSMRRVLTRMYEEEGIEVPKSGARPKKKARTEKPKATSRAPKAKAAQASPPDDGMTTGVTAVAAPAPADYYHPPAPVAAMATYAPPPPPPPPPHVPTQLSDQQVLLAAVPTQLSDQQVLLAAVQQQEDHSHPSPAPSAQYYSMPPLPPLPPPEADDSFDIVGV